MEGGKEGATLGLPTEEMMRLETRGLGLVLGLGTSAVYGIHMFVDR